MTIAAFDVNGDGRLDRILLYAHLSNRRAGEGFTPTSFTLEVMLAGGGTYKAQIDHPLANVTIHSAGPVSGRPGDELFLDENQFQRGRSLLARERQLILVYSFTGHSLIRAGSFWWWGGSARKYGITCHEQPPAAIIQHEFLRQGRHWRRIDTTYRWFGPTLHRTTTATSEEQGPPSQSLTTVDCRFA